MADVYVVLCEYVSVHTDGTHSVLRGGIENWSLAELPAVLSFWVFAHVPADTLPLGKQGLSVQMVSPSGLVVARVEGEVTIADTHTSTRVTSALTASVQQYGAFHVQVQVGDARGAVLLDVRQAMATEAR
jgi:hypothetical protein